MNQTRDYNNILIINNQDFYKEIDLDDFEKERVILGNFEECDIKLNLNTQETISVYFNKINTSWQITEGENSYCIINNIKTPRKILLHGDQANIKFSVDKTELFKISFFIDFIIEKEDYDKVIFLENVDLVTIGSFDTNNIIIDDKLVDGEHCEIRKDENHQFYVADLKSKYGVHINGKKVNLNKIPLKENDFIIICGYKILYKQNCISISNSNEKIQVNGLKVHEKEQTDSLLEYPRFSRSPRLIYEIPSKEIEIEAPPQKESKVSYGFILTLIPLLGTVVIASLVSKGQNSTYLIYAGGMVAFTGVATIIAFVVQIRKSKGDRKKRKKLYDTYISDKEEEIQENVDRQIKNLKALNPDSDESLQFVTEFNRRLWERTPLHKDFLNIRVGIGDSIPSFKIKIPKETLDYNEDGLRYMAKETKAKFLTLEKVPICFDLLNGQPIGIIGERASSIKFLWNTIVNVTEQHYYEDVKVVLIAPESEKSSWEWIKWLPHVWSNKRDIRFIGFNKESAHTVLRYLSECVRQREEAKTQVKDPRFIPQFIVIVAEPKLVENESIMQYLEKPNKVGFTGVFVYNHIELLPRDCENIIEVGKNFKGKITKIKDADNITEFDFNNVDVKNCEDFAKKMAPIYVTASFTENSLRSYITLFDLYGIKKTTDLNIFNNWKHSKPYETMAVPIGVKLGDEVVYLNLHEKFHGPHGLVAGTTGSGKSELLQTYIASAALNYHPHDVVFIIIDYKGGGMANQFKNLPHLVGTITNLDGNQINRALVSIKSELKRRQQIFGQYNVNHIDAYMKLYKTNKAKEAIPHLIIIADEFAELKSDQPDFMRELVSAARIGRSLGVHLILATQKPAGVVDNQIWSNSKFKLCLKVQNSEDSKEVIKSDLAASIVEPGRAYFQVGNNEIFELFQSAWSGAKKYDDDDVNKKEIEISEVSIEGMRKIIYSSKDENKGKKSKTQLDVVIEEVQKVCDKNSIKRLHGPWLPPLEQKILLDDLLTAEDSSQWICPVIGFLDDPERQVQKTLKIDLGEEGHLLVIGAPGYGKTTLIQTLIVSLMKTYTPDDVNIYVLDFGTRTLKIFEDSCYVGGVITSDDDEKMGNFIKYILREINHRKEIFSSMGVGSLNAYKEASIVSISQIIIVIDNYAALLEFYPDLEESLTLISREGGTLGVSLVITTTNYSSIRYRMVTNFKLTIALNCVDKAEYSNIFGVCRVKPENVKGRGLVKFDGIYEFQTALPIEGDNEIERSFNIKELVKTKNSKWKGEIAKLIPFIPIVLKLTQVLQEESNNNKLSAYKFIAGLSFDEMEYTFVDLAENPIINVIGKSKSGKTNILKSIAYTLDKNNDSDKLELYLIDSSNFGLHATKDLHSVKSYGTSFEEIKDSLLIINDIVEERTQRQTDEILDKGPKFNEKEFLDSMPMITLFIDDIKELLNNIENQNELMNILSKVISDGKNVGVSMIVAGKEDDFNKNVYLVEFIKQLKSENFGFMLDGVNNQRFYDIKLKYGQVQKPLQKGDAYFINKEGYQKVKTTYLDI